MKRRSFFRSLIAAPAAAVGAIVILGEVPNVSDVDQDDWTLESSWIKANGSLENGTYSINEVRGLCGLDPIENGNKHRVSLNPTTLLMARHLTGEIT